MRFIVLLFRKTKEKIKRQFFLLLRALFALFLFYLLYNGILRRGKKTPENSPYYWIITYDCEKNLLKDSALAGWKYNTFYLITFDIWPKFNVIPSISFNEANFTVN